MRILFGRLQFDKSCNHKFPQLLKCELHISKGNEITPFTKTDIITSINVLYYDDSLSISKLYELQSVFSTTPENILTYITIKPSYFTKDKKLKTPVIKTLKKYLFNSTTTLITPETKAKADCYYSKHLLSDSTYNRLKNCNISTVNDIISYLKSLETFSTVEKIKNELSTL